jgi:hypothetical protein
MHAQWQQSETQMSACGNTDSSRLFLRGKICGKFCGFQWIKSGHVGKGHGKKSSFPPRDFFRFFSS